MFYNNHEYLYRSLLVWCCYQPPSLTIGFYERLECSVEKASCQDVILIGDFNAKHTEWFAEDITNRPGAALKDLMDSYNLDQLCSFPTHVDKIGHLISLLDLAFTNLPRNHFLTRTGEPVSSSDHLPVLVEVSLHAADLIKHTKEPKAKRMWKFAAKDRHALQKSFLPSDWDFVQSPKITDINDLLSQWKSQFFFREVGSSSRSDIQFP